MLLLVVVVVVAFVFIFSLSFFHLGVRLCVCVFCFDGRWTIVAFVRVGARLLDARKGPHLPHSGRQQRKNHSNMNVMYLACLFGKVTLAKNVCHCHMMPHIHII